MMSTICPQLETVVSSRDMLSRVGRWSLIASPCLWRRLRAAARSLLAAGHFPQSLIHTIWFNSNPVAFFYVCPSRFTGSHIASEIRDSQQPCTRLRTVELLVDLRRRKSGGAPPPLHGLTVNSLPQRHQIPFSANGVWIDVHSL